MPADSETPLRSNLGPTPIESEVHAMAQSGLLALPTETIEHICFFVGHQDLSALMLSCQLLLVISKPFLYETVLIRDDKGWSAFARAIRKEPRLGARVITLWTTSNVLPFFLFGKNGQLRRHTFRTALDYSHASMMLSLPNCRELMIGNFMDDYDEERLNIGTILH